MPSPSTFLKSFSFGSLLLMAAVSRCAAAAPAIAITNLPAYGVLADLKGVVIGGNPATQAVAVFIYVPGFGWVSKPTCAQPLTTIQPDGSWDANITTGGAGDATATRVAAMLVSTNYNQPCVLGAPTLPTNVYAQAIAKTIITRPSPGVRFVSFAGYDWWVKNSTGPVGPGPNIFSDSTTNVFADTNGWLHLRISNRTNHWQCAEIVSSRTFGYGSYRFEVGFVPNPFGVNFTLGNLNPNVTLGLFTWSDDPAFTDREIDVEGGRWGDASDTNNAQFVVQPFDGVNHLVRYRVPPALTDSTHLFVWQTNRISWQAQTNGYSPLGTNLISSYAFTNTADIPLTGDENVRLNLWLVNGTPPSDNKEVEVIIKNFNFVPLGFPPPATVGSLVHSLGNQPQFGISTLPDWHYDAQASSDLFSWSDLGTFLATNGSITVQDTNSTASNRRFYRTITLP